jgi:polyisoprenoid-binding protein YceI
MHTATLSTAAPSEQLAGTRWLLDPAGSSAEFTASTYWGLVKVHGRFAKLDGQLEVDASGERRLDLTLDVASLDTGNRRRDKHLRSADFFDAARHPEVRFRSARVSAAAGDRLSVVGELQAGGGRVELTLEPSIRQVDDQIEVDAATTVDQRLLGMTASPLGMIRVPARLTVHARLRRCS